MRIGLLVASAALLAFMLSAIALRALEQRSRRKARNEARKRREDADQVQELAYRRELRGERHLESTDGPDAA